MKAFGAKLWRDDSGAIISSELVIVATIAVLAMVAGLSEVSQNVNNELEDVGAAFGSFNQSYQYSGVQGHFACPAGSSFSDNQDMCDGENDIQPHDASGEN
ncbi:MAG: branched-chain amino acid aminotransferase [Planctomycetota bacterium]|nr:MAG: branched-chain amino acid aminotransferase [Planctomycetota bacterium]